MTRLLFLLLFAISASAQTVALMWDANTETNLAGYRVHYGISSRTYTATNDVGKVTQTTISNLTAGITYYFAVTAYDENGFSSEFSDQVLIALTKPLFPPAPPNLRQIALQLQATTNLLAWEKSGHSTNSVTRKSQPKRGKL